MTAFAAKIKIGTRLIGKESEPFVIAEMSGNHNQSLERALKIVDAAASAGAHALKIQTYTADTMTLNHDGPGFVIEDKNSLWHGKKLYDLYKEAATPWEWHKPIFERCKKLGLISFSTPFDETAVDFLESLKVDCYKIASFENTDIPLITKVAATLKPVIVSTGMATEAEIHDIVTVMKKAGNKNLILLKCTSTYPADPVASNIVSIPHYQNLFGCQVGLSDHTGGIGAAVASVALGATVIEKHFTLRRADGGVDSAFSLEPEEMQSLVIETRRAWQALGEVHFGTAEKEKQSLAFRRSLYVVKNIQTGEKFTRENVRAIRPGFGLSPKHHDEILNKPAARDILKGEPFAWDMLKKT